jgi:hypothetical protein
MVARALGKGKNAIHKKWHYAPASVVAGLVRTNKLAHLPFDFAAETTRNLHEGHGPGFFGHQTGSGLRHNSEFAKCTPIPNIRLNYE